MFSINRGSASQALAIIKLSRSEIKYFFLSIFFISTIWQYNASAQFSVGIRTGAVLNTSVYNTPSFQHTRNAGLGMEAGLSFLYPTTSKISIFSGLDFIGKNYTVNNTIANQNIRHTILNNYLQLPVGISTGSAEKK